MRHLARDTAPEYGVCGHCLRGVLRCWVDGLHAVATATAINLRGQLTAIENGLFLYQLETGHGLARAAYLTDRDQFRIATGKPHIALPEHKCEQKWEGHRDRAAQQRLDEWLNPARRKAATQIPPPF